MAYLQQREEQAEKFALFIALVGTARAFLPMGRQVAKMMVQSGMKFMGCTNSNINVDEVVDRAEQEQQQQQSEDSMGKVEQPSPPRPRRIEEQFEDVTPEEAAWAQLNNNSPPQPTKRQQPQQQPEQQQQPIAQTQVLVQQLVTSSKDAIGQPGYVLQEVQKYEPNKKIGLVEDEQQHKTAPAMTQAGKRAQQLHKDPFQWRQTTPGTRSAKH